MARMDEHGRVRGDLRLQILAADALAMGDGKSVCVYCGKGLTFHDRRLLSHATVDHITPRSSMGEDEYPALVTLPENLVSCCRECNEAKGNQPLEEFLDWMQASLIASYTGSRQLPDAAFARETVLSFGGRC